MIGWQINIYPKYILLTHQIISYIILELIMIFHQVKTCQTTIYFNSKENLNVDANL